MGHTQFFSDHVGGMTRCLIYPQESKWTDLIVASSGWFAEDTLDVLKKVVRGYCSQGCQ